MAGQLEGRVAIVTGGASGMGRATALLFAREGARVAALDLNAAGAEDTARQILAAGGQAFAQRTDVTKEPEVQAAVSATRERYGRVDVLAACAGHPG